MARYVLDLNEIDHAGIAVVGGKAAHLSELSRIEGIHVPPGFCVTTDAFRRIMAELASQRHPGRSAGSLDNQVSQLSRLAAHERDGIRALSAQIRLAIEQVVIPDDVAAEITVSLARLGEHVACAVRSSATAEDLPTASFAGQHDTYLNVTGAAATLDHVRRCWASLFTERAVTYRLRNGLAHRKVRMAVVVQQMVSPHASGILFTADPVTGNRKLAVVEATLGLGEALVSGMVNADVYRVRDGQIIDGTEPQDERALTGVHVVRLAELGRSIEAHFGRPQDIEWCRVDDDFLILQSRPITTLFPIPRADDDAHHVYVSVGHGQMMTDAMKPLGISVWQLTAATPMHEAGARLFVDVSRALTSAAGRAGLLSVIGKADPLTGDALETIIERGFIPLQPDQLSPAPPPGAFPAPPIPTNPAIVAGLIGRSEASVAALKRNILGKRGSALIDFILADFQELKRVLFDPLSHQAIMAGMKATWWLNDHVEEWLGERNAADTLTRSAPGNVTAEMGLALMAVADVIRPHPEVVTFLQRAGDHEDFLNHLPGLEGGRQAREAILGWLDKYGMRGVGEIDITRPRWSESPTTLLPMLLGNIRNFHAGTAERRFEQGRQEAWKKEQELLQRLRALPNGAQKAEETKRMIDRVQTFAGYREYPKYGMVSRYFVYKHALLEEAGRLVQAGVLRDKEDIFYLRLEEIRHVVRTQHGDEQLIRGRKDAFASHQALTPPRVLTSDGEIIAGAYGRDHLPAGTLVGLAVSAGTVEGRARVILDMADADLETGDILVTTFTDPSWTPLFLAISGLVTEVGGLMTHGAVIAREYGVPAVVGVEHATRLIRDGQRIRLHATEGYIEILA